MFHLGRCEKLRPVKRNGERKLEPLYSSRSFLLPFVLNSIICRSTKKDSITAIARPATESLIFTSAVQSEKSCKMLALGWVA